METDKLIELLLKEKEGLITLTEKKELNFLLSKCNNKENITNIVDTFFDAKLTFRDIDADFISKSADKLATRLSKQSNTNLNIHNKFRKLSNYVSIAALLLLIIGTALFYQYPTSKIKKSPNIIYTTKGSKSNIILPDGSKVWINADSKLMYDENFGKTTRDVTLIGEAFFDVVQDKNHPFIVHTTTIDVKVLGTAFNVRAYENEKNTQTTLLRGKVEVLLNHTSAQKIFLNPKEKIIVKNKVKFTDSTSKISNNSPNVTFSKIELSTSDSMDYETGWLKNRLVFRQEAFEEIINELERWYNVKFIVKKTPKKLLRGTFQNDSLEDILKAFQYSADINYKIEKDTVIIY